MVRSKVNALRREDANLRPVYHYPVQLGCAGGWNNAIRRSLDAPYVRAFVRGIDDSSSLCRFVRRFCFVCVCMYCAVQWFIVNDDIAFPAGVLKNLAIEFAASLSNPADANVATLECPIGNWRKAGIQRYGLFLFAAFLPCFNFVSVRT